MAKTKYPGQTPWTDFWTPRKDRLTPPRGMSIISYGPGHLGLRQDVEPHSGAMAFVRANRALFSTSSTSFEEGVLYWGLLQLRGPSGAEGGWQYQRKVRPGGQKVGSATVDFLIDAVPKPIACRVVTRWFHLGADPEKVGSDLDQVYMLQDQGYDVIDAFSHLYMRPPVEPAVLDMVERVVAKDPSLSPVSHTYLGK